jgi:hypothetical protein
MTRLAGMHHLRVWYLHADVDAPRGQVAARASSERLRMFEANVAKMRRKTRMRAFPKLTERVDGEWSGVCRYEGAYRDEVLTSLIVLKGDDLGDDRGGDRSADDVAAGHRRRDARPDRAAVVAALADVHRTRRDDLAQARRRIWEARTAAPLHVLQGDGLGRVRPRSAARRAVHTTRNVEPSRSTR